jgi:hypothetical protein
MNPPGKGSGSAVERVGGSAILCSHARRNSLEDEKPGFCSVISISR